MADIHKAQGYQAMLENEYLKDGLARVEQKAIEAMLATTAEEDELRWKAQCLAIVARQLPQELEALMLENTPQEKQDFDPV